MHLLFATVLKCFGSLVWRSALACAHLPEIRSPAVKGCLAACLHTGTWNGRWAIDSVLLNTRDPFHAELWRRRGSSGEHDLRVCNRAADDEPAGRRAGRPLRPQAAAGLGTPHHSPGCVWDTTWCAVLVTVVIVVVVGTSSHVRWGEQVCAARVWGDTVLPLHERRLSWV